MWAYGLLEQFNKILFSRLSAVDIHVDLLGTTNWKIKKQTSPGFRGLGNGYLPALHDLILTMLINAQHQT